MKTENPQKKMREGSNNKKDWGILNRNVRYGNPAIAMKSISDSRGIV